MGTVMQMTANIETDFEQARTHFAAGRYPEATGLCHGILALQPRHAKALHMLARILTDEGKSTEALACIEQARQLDPANSAVQSAYGRLLLDAGRLEDALGALQAALNLDAGNFEACHFLAVAFLHSGKFAQAESTLRAALLRQPQMPELLDDLGTVLARKADHTGAQAAFEEALRCAPDDLGALEQLALWHEQNNRVEDALRLVSQGLARHPADPVLRFILGRCRRRQARYAEAAATLGALRDVRAPALKKDVEFELAMCADAMHEPDVAWAHARQANALAKAIYPHALRQGKEFLALVERLYAGFTPAWVESWSGLPLDTEMASPMFLVGFPRSGTTLLDTMLSASPEVEVLEERPTLEAVIGALTGKGGRYPDALRDLSREERTAWRQSYYTAAGTDGYQHGKRILDKSPFYSIHAGLIQRLFPQAPVLFMLRHPCDVVLSCCMTNFEISPGTANFLDMDSSVRLYCAVMSLWQKYLEVLPVAYYPVRYEDLVVDEEKALRGTARFLGLEWTSAMLEHPRQARSRGRIQSASYAQVSQPLYADACGRWVRYRKYLEPYLDQLRPWCERFGYGV